MTLEKFARRNTTLAQHLNHIMHREQTTAQDANVLLSPRLRDLFVAQERLLTAAEKCLGHAAGSIAR